MQIREEQFQAFEQNAGKQFAKRVVDFVLQVSPESVAGQTREQFHSQAEAGIARARDFGLMHSSSVGLFAALTLIAGPEFDREPECRQVLDDPLLPPDARLHELLAPGNTIPWLEIAGRRRKTAR